MVQVEDEQRNQRNGVGDPCLDDSNQALLIDGEEKQSERQKRR